MRLRVLVVAVCLAGAVSLPAAANDRDALARLESVLDPQVLLRGLITETDVSLVFAYVKAALLASATGGQAETPPELARRAEQLGNDLKLRGTLVGIALLSALEASAKQALREALAPPPAARSAVPPSD